MWKNSHRNGNDKSSPLGTATLEPITIFLPCSQDEKGGSHFPYPEDLLLRNPGHPLQRRRTIQAQGHDAEGQNIFYDGIDVATDPEAALPSSPKKTPRSHGGSV